MSRNQYPQGSNYRGIHTVGRSPQLPQQVPPTTPAPEEQRVYRNGLRIIGHEAFVEVPAWYTISIILGGATGAEAAGSTALRPERFEARRATFAAQGDVPPFIDIPLGGSVTGSCVEITWGDEFTRFLGEQPVLMNSLFGTANGFLDFPAHILFQGRQSLNAKLRRLNWPGIATEPADTRIDITFHGVGLLPANAGGVSGSL